MNFRRSDQLNPMLRDEIAALLPTHFREEKYGLLTVTKVETTKNFDSARVWVSCLKNGHQFLEDAAHKIYKLQKELDRKLVMKRVPKLIFALDETAALAEKLDQLMEK
jgi:ribosome-binding factor A